MFTQASIFFLTTKLRLCILTLWYMKQNTVETTCSDDACLSKKNKNWSILADFSVFNVAYITFIISSSFSFSNNSWTVLLFYVLFSHEEGASPHQTPWQLHVYVVSLDIIVLCTLMGSVINISNVCEHSKKNNNGNKNATYRNLWTSAYEHCHCKCDNMYVVLPPEMTIATCDDDRLLTKYIRWLVCSLDSKKNIVLMCLWFAPCVMWHMEIWG